MLYTGNSSASLRGTRNTFKFVHSIDDFVRCIIPRTDSASTELNGNIVEVEFSLSKTAGNTINKHITTYKMSDMRYQ